MKNDNPRPFQNKKFKLQSKYTFIDLEVLERVGENTYQNLSDYQVSPIQPVIEIHSNEKFLLSFCGFVNRDLYRCVAKVNLNELFELANINNERFVKQIHYNVDEDLFEHIAALMCTKRIIAYNYGKIIREDENLNIYSFHRNVICDKKHTTREILKKRFFDLEDENAAIA